MLVTLLLDCLLTRERVTSHPEAALIPLPAGCFLMLVTLRGWGHELSQAPGECPHPELEIPKQEQGMLTSDVIMPAGNERPPEVVAECSLHPLCQGEPKLSSTGLCPRSSRLHSNGQGWGRRACGGGLELSAWRLRSTGGHGEMF